MSLEEQLARRLEHIAEEGFRGRLRSGGPESDHVEAAFAEGMRAMARECLRQMEWARQNCNALFVKDGANERKVADVVQYLPLTLAPEDWKP